MSIVSGPLHPPKPALRPTVLSASILTLVIVAFLFTVGALLQSLHFEAGVAVTQWLFFLLPALYYLKLSAAKPAVFARVQPLRLKYVPTIILLVISTWIILFFVETLILSGLISLGFEPLEKIPHPASVTQLIVYYLIIAVTPGVCEEVIFRGAVLPSVEQHGIVPALLFSAGLFALMHMSFLNIISTFVLGLIIGLVVLKTGSLFAGILYHTLNNMIAVSVLYFSRQIDLETFLGGTEIAFGAAICAAPGLALIGLVSGLLLLQRQSRINRLLPKRGGWLPRGWLNWALILIAAAFLLNATLEILLGFGFFDFLGLPL